MNERPSVRRWAGLTSGWPLFRFVSVTVAGFAAAVLQAADDSKIIFPGGSGGATAPSSSGSGAANAITLVVAVAFAAVGGWLFWRNRRAPGMGRDARSLAIEETRSLGNRQYLVVASYEGRKFLLGVCPGRIDMLAPLKDGTGTGTTDR